MLKVAFVSCGGQRAHVADSTCHVGPAVSTVLAPMLVLQARRVRLLCAWSACPWCPGACWQRRPFIMGRFGSLLGRPGCRWMPSRAIGRLSLGQSGLLLEQSWVVSVLFWLFSTLLLAIGAIIGASEAPLG
eukprot:5692436-Pyramimonas_sp.AAC.1